MHILELCEQYLGPNSTKNVGGDVYVLALHGNLINGTDYSSLRIWESTNSFCHFRNNNYAGGPVEFARYVLNLSPDIINNISKKSKITLPYLSKAVRELDTNYHRTEYNLFDILGEPGYNNYISSRGISYETSQQFGLEIDGENVIIPLVEDGKRTGSIIRYNTTSKSSRYRVFLIDGYSKPSLWPYKHISKLNNDSIIILVEGAWSVMNWIENFGYETKYIPVATLGTTINVDTLKSLFEFPIIVVLDDDKGGISVEEQTNKIKEKYGLRIYTYRPQRTSKVDTALFGPLYVDDMTKHEIQELKLQLDEIIQNRVSKRGGIISRRRNDMDFSR